MLYILGLNRKNNSLYASIQTRVLYVYQVGFELEFTLAIYFFHFKFWLLYFEPPEFFFFFSKEKDVAVEGTYSWWFYFVFPLTRKTFFFEVP